MLVVCPLPGDIFSKIALPCFTPDISTREMFVWLPGWAASAGGSELLALSACCCKTWRGCELAATGRSQAGLPGGRKDMERQQVAAVAVVFSKASDIACI